jgi:hypothetical protein
METLNSVKRTSDSQRYGDESYQAKSMAQAASGQCNVRVRGLLRSQHEKAQPSVWLHIMGLQDGPDLPTASGTT